MTLPYDECRLNLVPEDSVIPETRTLVILNRRKGFVGCFLNSLWSLCNKARIR